MRIFQHICVGVLAVGLLAPFGVAGDRLEHLVPFLEQHCYDCHSDGMDKGGLDFDTLGYDLANPAVFATWERVFDRVGKGEMPPEKIKRRPSSAEKVSFAKTLAPPLLKAHQTAKGTVLRRLNRREYQHVMNDLFGTQVNLEGMLPEDGRSHEFDNVGEALGISMAHLELYLEGARKVFAAAVADAVEPPASKIIPANFRESEIKKAIGDYWKQLDDGAIVRFQGGGYPSGLLRNSGVPQAGRYRIAVTGYAYQSDQPVVVSLGGESYQRGSAKPVYTFVSFPPGKPTTVTFETWVEKNYMLVVEPQEIALPQPRPKDINAYPGPGFAFVSASLEGPLYDEFPSRGHRLIFEGLERSEVEPGNPNDRKRSWYRPKFEIVSNNEAADAMQSIRRVAEHAWRRPVVDAELQPYLQLFQEDRAGKADFESALRTAITALFVSPKFLYLDESPGRLDDHALANRLALFLTRTAPDAELRTLADRKQLAGQADTLSAQTERLLRHPHFDRFLTDFTEVWLNLRDLEFTAPDRTLFPEFDPYLLYSMPRESVAFLRELIDANLPVQNLVRSDFAMLNSRLARHYQLPPVSGTKLQKVRLPANSLRGGVLSQAGVLKVAANGTNTSPVMRGVWVLERILNRPPQPPPPGIPGVEPDIRGASTLRELLAQHRDMESCQSCHREIDPPGFALEVFNPIGGYREHYRSLGDGEKLKTVVKGRTVRYRKGPPVDASGELPDGRAFSNYQEFRDALASNEATLAKAFVAKLLTFATGREMGFSDRPEISRIVKATAADGYRVRDLVHEVTQSEIFITK